jgi:hypothetical protein
MYKMRCSNLLQTTPNSTPDESPSSTPLPDRPDRSNDAADPDESSDDIDSVVHHKVKHGLLVTLHLDNPDGKPGYCIVLNIQDHKPGCLVDWNIARSKKQPRAIPGPGYL